MGRSCAEATKAECNRMLCAVAGTLGTFAAAARRRALRVAALVLPVACMANFAGGCAVFFFEEVVEELCAESASVQARSVRSAKPCRRRHEDGWPDGILIFTLSL